MNIIELRKKLLGKEVSVGDYKTEIIAIESLKTWTVKEIFLVDTKAGFVCNISLILHYNPDLKLDGWSSLVYGASLEN